MPHFTTRLCPLVLHRDKLRKRKEKKRKIAAVSSNRKFLELILLRDDRNKI